jgi:hypothetical protein
MLTRGFSGERLQEKAKSPKWHLPGFGGSPFDHCSDDFFSHSTLEKVFTYLDFVALGEKVENIVLDIDLLGKEMRGKPLFNLFMFPFVGSPREQAHWKPWFSLGPILARLSPGIVFTLAGFVAKPSYTLSHLTIYQ